MRIPQRFPLGSCRRQGLTVQVAEGRGQDTRTSFNKCEIICTHLIIKRHRTVDVRHSDERMVCAEYIFENIHCFPVKDVGFLVLSLRVNQGVICASH